MNERATFWMKLRILKKWKKLKIKKCPYQVTSDVRHFVGGEHPQIETVSQGAEHELHREHIRGEDPENTANFRDKFQKWHVISKNLDRVMRGE